MMGKRAWMPRRTVTGLELERSRDRPLGLTSTDAAFPVPKTLLLQFLQVYTRNLARARRRGDEASA